MVKFTNFEEEVTIFDSIHQNSSKRQSGVLFFLEIEYLKGYIANFDKF